ncbi:S24 family peptidase [Flavobacterium sp. CAU 1735]|uniref:S24 family peptidase n=1 Tax=Flavobacterium sp. CAU 1735 TaxID=3140361 RepID=UPI0032609937
MTKKINIDEKYTNIKERVLYFAKNQNIGIEFFLESIDMSYGSFKGKAKEGSLNSDAVAKILTTYPNINIEWLLTGVGSMEKDKTAIFSLKSDRIIKNQSVPLYSIKASAGIVTLFADSSNTKPVDYIEIPNLPKCDGALYITGDSMYPLLKSGDIVMYKQLSNVKENIIFGEMYLIGWRMDDDPMITVKYIHKSEKSNEHIKLVSENKHHHDIEIHLSKITALALIKASIRINTMS